MSDDALAKQMRKILPDNVVDAIQDSRAANMDVEVRELRDEITRLRGVVDRSNARISQQEESLQWWAGNATPKPAGEWQARAMLAEGKNHEWHHRVEQHYANYKKAKAENTRLRAALREIIELEMTDPYDGTGGPIAHAIAIVAIEAEGGKKHEL